MTTLILTCLLALIQAQPADKERAEDLMQDGWKLFKQQQFGEAAGVFQQAVELDGENANAWNGLGWSKFNSGESQEAEVAFKRVVELSPNHPAGLNGLGQLYLGQGKYDEAEKYFLQCKDTAPAAWYGMSRMYLLQESGTDAERWIQRIIEADQQNGQEEFIQRMLTAAKNKKLDDDLKEMLTPRNASPAMQDVQRGFTLMKQGQMEQARGASTARSSRRPKTPTCRTAWAGSSSTPARCRKRRRTSRSRWS